MEGPTLPGQGASYSRDIGDSVLATYAWIHAEVSSHWTETVQKMVVVFWEGYSLWSCFFPHLPYQIELHGGQFPFAEEVIILSPKILTPECPSQSIFLMFLGAIQSTWHIPLIWVLEKIEPNVRIHVSLQGHFPVESKTTDNGQLKRISKEEFSFIHSSEKSAPKKHHFPLSRFRAKIFLEQE